MAITVQDSDLNNPNKPMGTPPQATGLARPAPVAPRGAAPAQPAQPAPQQPVQPRQDAPAAVQPAQPARPKGSGFTNLSTYIRANQNNQLGNVVAGGVQQQANAARNNIAQGQQQFQQQSEAGRMGDAADVTNRDAVLNAIASGKAIDPSAASQFQNFMSGQYTGPMGIANEDQLIRKAAQAEQLSQLAGSVGGRQELLKGLVGGKNYTAGQSAMDNLLLGATGAKQLQDAKQMGAGLSTQAATTAQMAQEQAQQRQKEAQDFAANTKGMIGAQQGSVEGQTAKQLKAAQDAEQKSTEEFNAIKDQLGSAINNNDMAGITKTIDEAVKSGKMSGNAANRIKKTTQAMQYVNSGQLDTDINNAWNNEQKLKKDLARMTGSPQYYSKQTIEQTKQQLAAAQNDLYGRLYPLKEQREAGAFNPANFGRTLLDSFKVNEAQNLTQTAVATDAQRAQMAALAQLTGAANPYSDSARYQKSSAAFDNSKAYKNTAFEALKRAGLI